MMPWLGPLPAGVTHRYVLLRHAEPVADARGRCYGRLDVALSTHGRRQAANLAETLGTACIAHVYASPRIRALETARLAGSGCSAPLQIDDRLGELNFGAFEGRTYTEVQRDHPGLYAQWMTQPTAVRFPDGENYDDLRARVAASTLDLRRRHPREAVLLVTHGGVIRTLLAQALGMPPALMFRLDLSHASLSCIDAFGDTPVVRAINWATAPAQTRT